MCKKITFDITDDKLSNLRFYGGCKANFAIAKVIEVIINKIITFARWQPCGLRDAVVPIN